MARSEITTCVRDARRILLDDAQLPMGLMRPAIQRSWERTRAYGLRPRDRHLFGHWVSAREARRVKDSYQDLIGQALPDMQDLWESIRSRNWIVLLTNRDGTIVHTLNEGLSAPRELSPFRCGRRLAEAALGTNAPCIAAADVEPVLVRGQEHFLEELQGFDCAAVPIFGLDGRLAGVLDVTSYQAVEDPRILERVVTAAASIENRVYEHARSDFLVRLHEDPRYIGTPRQGMVLVREDGAILSVNRAARAMLALENAVPTPPLNLRELLEHDLILTPPSHRRGPAATRTSRGTRLYAEVVRGSTGRSMPVRLPLPSPVIDRRLHAAMSEARNAFRTGRPVLVQGEPGSGKEWFARTLHEAMPDGGPFVVASCAGRIDGIAELALFQSAAEARDETDLGCERDRVRRPPRCTLFLDNIEALPKILQTRLLRAFESRSFLLERDDAQVAVDVRIVSASQCDLLPLVRAGTFCKELYARLAGLTIPIPALKDREDLDALVDAILSSLAQGNEQPCTVLAAARERVRTYNWPGNLRQLRHALQVASILAGPGHDITADMLDEQLVAVRPVPASVNGPRTLHQIQLASIREVVDSNRNNISAAARVLGVSRTTLYKYLEAANFTNPPGRT